MKRTKAVDRVSSKETFVVKILMPCLLIKTSWHGMLYSRFRKTLNTLPLPFILNKWQMIQEKNKNYLFIGGCQKQGFSLSVRKPVRKKYTVNHRKYEAAMKIDFKIKIKLN